MTSRTTIHRRCQQLATAIMLATVVGLSACGGGGGADAVGTSPAGAAQPSYDVPTTVIAAAASNPPSDGPALQVVSLTRQSETAVTGTVFEYVMKVQARNLGATAQQAVNLKLVSVGAGTTIVDADASMASVPGRASVEATDTITFRHDRSQPFDAQAWRWDAQGTISGKVMDGYLRGAIVYWDCNGNQVPDATEVRTTSGPGGAYSIAAAPSQTCQLLAQVPWSAVDEDTPHTTVGLSYSLAAAPDQFDLITPYTTMIFGALNADPTQSVATADDQLARSIGFTCGSLTVDYQAASSSYTTTCKNVVSTTAKFYRGLLQAQPADMLLSAASQQALKVLTQLTTTAGFLSSLELGMRPFVYEPANVARYLSSLHLLPVANASNKMFASYAGRNRVADEALAAAARLMNEAAVVRYGFANLADLSLDQKAAVARQLRVASAADPGLAQQPAIDGVRVVRDALLASASQRFGAAIDSETGWTKFFSNDPMATVQFVADMSSATLHVTLDTITLSSLVSPSTFVTRNLSTSAITRLGRIDVARITALAGNVDKASKLAKALTTFLQYRQDQAANRHDGLETSLTDVVTSIIDSVLELGDATQEFLRAGKSTVLFGSALVVDREDGLKVLVDIVDFFKEVLALGIEDTVVGGRVIAGLDMILQYGKAYSAGQDLLQASLAVQDTRVAAATSRFSDESAKILNDFYAGFISAYLGNFRIVDTAQVNSVQSAQATRLVDGSIEVAVQFGREQVASVPASIGQGACSAVAGAASASAATYRCSVVNASAGNRLMLGTASASVAGTPLWLDVAPLAPGAAQASSTAVRIGEQIRFFVTQVSTVVAAVFWDFGNELGTLVSTAGTLAQGAFSTVFQYTSAGVQQAVAYFSDAMGEFASSMPITITVAAPTAVSIVVTPTAVLPGSTATITVTGGQLPVRLSLAVDQICTVMAGTEPGPAASRVFSCTVGASSAPGTYDGLVTSGELGNPFAAGFSQAFSLTVSSPAGTVAPTVYRRLADTGSTTCVGYDAGRGFVAAHSCSAADIGSPEPAGPQDGQAGLDLSAADDADGPVGFSFSKITNGGEAVAVDRAVGELRDQWGCTRDNNTGLTWEVKRAGNATRDMHKLFYLQPTIGQRTVADYVGEINGIALCGHTDWRLPTVWELYSLLHFGRSNVGFADPRFFLQSDLTTSFMSSTLNRYNNNRLIGVQFGGLQSADSGGGTTAVGAFGYAMLVRGEPIVFDSVLNSSGELVSASWKLAGRICPVPGVYDIGIGTCQFTESAYSTSLLGGTIVAARESAGSATRWRLPNVKELLMQRDFEGLTQCQVARNDSPMVSSTSPPGAPNEAWVVTCAGVDRRGGTQQGGVMLVRDQ